MSADPKIDQNEVDGAPEISAATHETSAADNPGTGNFDDLHDLFTVPADDVEDPLAGLRDDPNYAALIRDLEYIAREARQLFEDPSDTVWDKIQSQIDSETPKE